MASLPRQAAGKGAHLQLSPHLGQSPCEGDVYEHSIPARLCRSNGRPSRRLRLLGISRGGCSLLRPPPPRLAAGFAMLGVQRECRGGGGEGGATAPYPHPCVPTNAHSSLHPYTTLQLTACTSSICTGSPSLPTEYKTYHTGLCKNEGLGLPASLNPSSQTARAAPPYITLLAVMDPQTVHSLHCSSLYRIPGHSPFKESLSSFSNARRKVASNGDSRAGARASVVGDSVMGFAMMGLGSGTAGRVAGSPIFAR